MPLADATYAWPGDRVTWIDPVTEAIDPVPWRVKDAWAGACLIVREEGLGMHLFGSQWTRREVSEAGMRRLSAWRSS
jgi:hypothetical protein